LDRVIDWFAPAENPSDAIYGTILIGALLAAEDGLHESFAGTIGSAVIAAFLVWLAHAYGLLLGRRLSGETRLTTAALTHALRHESVIIKGAAIPLLALLAAWAFGATQHTAVNIALWSTVATVVALEVIAGTRMHTTRTELGIEVGVGATLGAGIIALKVLLH